RPHSQCAVLGSHARAHDDGWALRDDRAHARGRRIARGKAEGAALQRHFPDPWTAFRRPRRRRHPDHGRPHLFSRPDLGPHRGALCAAPPSIVLKARLMARKPAPSVFAPEIIGPAISDSFKKLDPRWLVHNPVIFTTAVAALLATIYFLR